MIQKCPFLFLFPLVALACTTPPDSNDPADLEASQDLRTDPDLAQTPDLSPAWDLQGKQPPALPPIPATLDVGLYWFGLSDMHQKHQPGVKNPYYDPRKPTVIHIHGWRRGAAAGGLVKSFNYKRNEPSHGLDVNTADAWVRAGWNIGFLFWGQLADEDLVWDAEAKMWSKNGPRGLRYRMADGSYKTDLGGVDSVLDLLLPHYLSALWDFQGPTLRLTGHSLANQLVLSLSERVLTLVQNGQVPSTLLVKRGALLDPFWSIGEKDFLSGQWTGERSRILARKLAAAGVAIEHHKTSAINDLLVGDSNLELQKTTAFAELRPDFIPAIALEARHSSAGQLYYYNFGFAKTKECVPSGAQCPLSGKDGPGPLSSDERILEIMAQGHKHILVEGTTTSTPADDVFRREAR